MWTIYNKITLKNAVCVDSDNYEIKNNCFYKKTYKPEREDFV